MSISKKLGVLSVLMLLQSSCSPETGNYQQSNILATSKGSDSHNYSQYIGKWRIDTYDSKKEPISSLSIDINDISASSIEGKYCYISSYGKKIDCLNDFQGIYINDNQYLITFDSSFNNIQGKATLTLEEEKVIWTLKEFPADLGVSARKHAVLLKDTNQQTSTSISTENIATELHTTNYIINIRKAFIYKQPNVNSITSSYFIKGDEVEALAISKNWIKVSYLKDSKTGWLRLNDLKALKNLDSTDDKIQDRPEEIRLDNTISSNQGKYIITKNGIGNIPLGQNYDPNGFEKLESQLEGVDNCFLATSKKYPKYQHSLYFQFVDNIFVGASISSMRDNKIPFESYNGIKIGDTTETVLKLHGKQPDEIFNNIHSDEPIFIYWTDISEKIGLRYDILSEKVVSMGLHYSPYIRYFEGCG